MNDMQSPRPGLFSRIGKELDRLWSWWMADIRRRRSLAGKAASISIGLLAICCVLSVPFSLFSPRTAPPTETEQAAAAPADPTAVSAESAPPEPSTVPTATTEPTTEPTATTRPTQTPRPTARPRPTATPVPARDNSDELAYGAYVAKRGETIGASLGEIGALLENPRLGDDNWIFRFAAHTVAVELSADEIAAYSPVPDSAAALHAALVDATGKCKAAMEPLRQGIDRRSVPLIEQSGVLMNQCQTQITETMPMMEAWVRQVNQD